MADNDTLFDVYEDNPELGIEEYDKRTIESIICENEYGLREKQQRYIRENCFRKHALKLAKDIFSDETLTARDDKVKKVKRFIQRVKRDSDKVEFTLDQREYIQNNCRLMRPIEMARILFRNDKIEPLSAEVKTMTKFIEIMGYDTEMPKENVAKYIAPQSDSRIVAKINKCVPGANYDATNLKHIQHKHVKSLKNYLSHARFISCADCLKLEEERELFESEFVFAVYDKTELNSEELNMYVTLCSLYVLERQIRSQLDMMNRQMESDIEDDDGSVKMALAQVFGSKSQELDKCQLRMKQLQESLSGIRSKKVEANAAAAHSLSSFVEMWKDEEERKKTILIAKAQELEARDTMKQLESMDSWIARVAGISQEELLDG